VNQFDSDWAQSLEQLSEPQLCYAVGSEIGPKLRVVLGSELGAVLGSRFRMKATGCSA
jgi:hypothetical protein